MNFDEIGSRLEDEDLMLRLLKEARLKFFWLVFAAVIGAGLFFSYTKFLVAPVYKANTTMYVYSNPEQDVAATVTSGDLTAAKDLAKTYIVVLESDTVLDIVTKHINDSFGTTYTAKDIRGMVTTTVVDETQVLNVAITAHSPEMAKQIADEIVKVAPDEIVRVTKAGGVEIIDEAKFSAVPVDQNVMRNTAIGAILGVAVAAGIILLIVLTNTKINEEEDLEKLSDKPVLGVVPLVTAPTGTNTAWSIRDGGGLGYEDEKEIES